MVIEKACEKGMPPGKADGVLESPRSYEPGGVGSGLDAKRISPQGILIQDPNGIASPAKWLGDKKLVVDGGGRVDWPKLRLDKTVYYVGDFAYGTCAEQGDAMEICEVLALFDTGKGSAANRKMMRVRWFWRPLQLEELGYPTDLTEYATNECFYTETFDDISTDCLEGYTPQPPLPFSTCLNCGVNCLRKINIWFSAEQPQPALPHTYFFRQEYVPGEEVLGTFDALSPTVRKAYPQAPLPPGPAAAAPAPAAPAPAPAAASTPIPAAAASDQVPAPPVPLPADAKKKRKKGESDMGQAELERMSTQLAIVQTQLQAAFKRLDRLESANVEAMRKSVPGTDTHFSEQ